MNRKQAIAKLSKMNIRTTADLDAECQKRAATGSIPSRFGLLKELVGFDAAMWLMNDLAVAQCCM